MAGFNVHLVTYCNMQTITTRLPMTGEFFITIIVASTNKERLSDNDPSKPKSWKNARNCFEPLDYV